MTPRERVITALKHKEPDRVPRSASFTPEFADKLRKRFGLESILFNPHGWTEHDLELKIGNDLLLTGQGFANSYYKNLKNNYTDEWGIEWKILIFFGILLTNTENIRLIFS
jgi:uroporphyrinogen decarboxylase